MEMWMQFNVMPRTLLSQGGDIIIMNKNIKFIFSMMLSPREVYGALLPKND